MCARKGVSDEGKVEEGETAGDVLVGSEGENEQLRYETERVGFCVVQVVREIGEAAWAVVTAGRLTIAGLFNRSPARR